MTFRAQVKRVYEDPDPGDGHRVLVDRVWPRGVSKERADWEWCKQVAPSTDLRKWYAHDEAKFEEFAKRYRDELTDPERAKALDHLRQLMRDATLTLLTATKRADISEATVLSKLLNG